MVCSDRNNYDLKSLQLQRVALPAFITRESEANQRSGMRQDDDSCKAHQHGASLSSVNKRPKKAILKKRRLVCPYHGRLVDLCQSIICFRFDLTDIRIPGSMILEI